jgi:hypothetical protein
MPCSGLMEMLCARERAQKGFSERGARMPSTNPVHPRIRNEEVLALCFRQARNIPPNPSTEPGGKRRNQRRQAEG